MSFIEDESSSTGYVALYQNENQRTLARPELEKEELARIKKALICTSDVVFQSSLIEAITDKVIFEECELEDMPFILWEIEKFVESSALPSETKRLLKMMLLSEGDWELFLSTIRKLELEEALQLHLRMRRSS